MKRFGVGQPWAIAEARAGASGRTRGGQVELDLGRRDRAIALLGETRTPDASLLDLKGRALFVTGRMADAVASFRQATALATGSSDPTWRRRKRDSGPRRPAKGFLRAERFGGEGVGRGERIRTSGLLLPKQAYYQAVLRPD